MAVTVTPAAPLTTSVRMLLGSYGASGASVAISVGAESLSKHRVVCSKLALSGTYITNGFALTPSAYGLKNIYGLLVLADGSSGGTAVPYLSTTGGSPVVKLVVDNVPTELANATSVTNHTYTVWLIGD